MKKGVGVMAVKKRSTTFYFLMAFFVSSIIFISGIGIGLVIDQLKSESITDNIISLQNSLQDAETELLLMDYLGGNLSCNYLMLKSSDLSEQSSELGTQLDLFEQSNQINSEAYTPLKEEYTRVLINNWLTLESIKSSCSANYTTILYFYDNDECEFCENQAYVLQYYKNVYENNLMIFALDAGINMSIVELLKYNYGVYEYPSLVINGVLYSGYQDFNELGELLNDSSIEISP
jgi:hypothetical protein